MGVFEGRIAIGIPHVGTQLEGYFFDSFIGLSMPKDTRTIRVWNKPVDLARNMIVEQMLAGDGGRPFTHLFFMDSDMRFPTEALTRLVQADKDVISGVYFSRDVPPIPHVYQFHHEDREDGSCPLAQLDDHGNVVSEYQHKDGFRGRWYRPLHGELAEYLKRHPEWADHDEVTVFPHTPDALVRAEATGGGCLLIKREVLEAGEWPWFKCHERSAGGEDFYFCEQARSRGFEVWANFAVQCQHEYRHVFFDRKDFIDCFNIGKPDEHDFARRPPIVEMSPHAGALVVNKALRHESEAS